MTLTELEKKFTHLKGHLVPFEYLANYMYARTENQFAMEMDVFGRKWPPNAPATKAHKRTNMVLTETSVLRKSFEHTVSDDTLSFFTTTPYAGLQFYGGTPAQFPYLWGPVPPRPFVGVKPGELSNLMENYISTVWRKA